jgi:ABC-type Fe3+ transport system permease subunit
VSRKAAEANPVALKLKAFVIPKLAPAFLYLTILLCCGLPLAWMAYQLIAHPDIWREAVPDAFRWKLIARTFGFAILAGSLATLISIPVGIALGTGGRFVRLLWFILPVPLLVPSVVITYGVGMLLERIGFDPIPQSAGDVVRCLLAIACWLWPISAMMLAYTLRRLDANVLMQARLDGALKHIIARLLLPTLLLAWLITLLLSLQEFAVFERTGISVISTEVRSIFETGASLDRSWSMEPLNEDAPAPQAKRMAAALAVMLPNLLGTGLLVILASMLWRRWSVQAEVSDDIAHVIRPSRVINLVGALLAIVVVAAPMVTMALSVGNRFQIGRILNEYAPQLRGSSSLAGMTALVGGACALIASIRGLRGWSIVLSLVAFLIGGQWVAIALITLFNRPWLELVYDSYAMPMIAYLCRFLWIVLIGALMTWSPNLRSLRELAATDGADRFATWRHVILPITWPLLFGAVLLLFTLSLTEVPATTLLQPTQTLVPMLMTWAHLLNYPSMIEASLMLVVLVMGAGIGVTMLVRRGMKSE